MKNTKVKVYSLAYLKPLVQVSIIITVAVLAPVLGNVTGKQAITGPIVNATLFFGIVSLPRKQAFAVALIPSCIALVVGQLPSILAPMVPFIMISNIILMVIFERLGKQNYFLKVFAASLIKYLFLYLTSLVVIELFIADNVAKNVAFMMSYPQLVTALVGGLLAYPFLRLFHKETSKSSIES